MSIDVVKDYLQNDKGEVIGVVLNTGEQARFVYPEPVSNLYSRFNPQDGIEATILGNKRWNGVIPKIPANSANIASSTGNMAARIVKLVNKKSGAILITSQPPIP